LAGNVLGLASSVTRLPTNEPVVAIKAERIAGSAYDLIKRLVQSDPTPIKANSDIAQTTI
jgi:hypothetical protein